MQGLTPYNHNLIGYGGDQNDNNDSPRYVFRTPKRQFFFNRIAVFIIIICLLTAFLLWFFNLTTGNLELNNYNIYFVGTLSSNNKASDSGSVTFDLYDTKFLTCIAEVNENSRYFLADKMYITLHEAEADIVAGIDEGTNRKILIFSAKNLKITADKDFEVNRKVSQLYDNAYKVLPYFNDFFSVSLTKNMSKEMFEFNITKIENEILDTINSIILENTQLSAVLTYYYTLILNDISESVQRYSNPYFSNSIPLKAAYNFYLSVKLINS